MKPSLPKVMAFVITDFDTELGYIRTEIEVEVLTVHFNTGKMRVRYYANIFNSGMSVKTEDVSNEPFMKKYDILGTQQ
jgi:hypothetical protein